MFTKNKKSKPISLQNYFKKLESRVSVSPVGGVGDAPESYRDVGLDLVCW